MSLLNRPSDGLVSVLLALRSTLIAYGPQPETRLLELCAPSSVVPDGKPDMARKTLTRWEQLGFFQKTDGVVSLAPSVCGIGAEDLNALRAFTLRLVLGPENNPTLTSDPDEDVENNRAADCTRAMAWALAQDPYLFQTIIGHPAAEALENQQGVQPRLFRNDTRWPGFKEWATFLGIAFPTSKGIVLDPAFAIYSVLSDVFAQSTELRQDEFLLRLANLLPIVDDGVYRQTVEAQIAKPWRVAVPNQISPSLSLALLTLETQGELRLEPRADAPLRILTGRGGRELRSFSHVVRVGVN